MKDLSGAVMTRLSIINPVRWCCAIAVGHYSTGSSWWWPWTGCCYHKHASCQKYLVTMTEAQAWASVWGESTAKNLQWGWCKSTQNQTCYWFRLLHLEYARAHSHHPGSHIQETLCRVGAWVHHVCDGYYGIGQPCSPKSQVAWKAALRRPSPCKGERPHVLPHGQAWAAAASLSLAHSSCGGLSWHSV
jgi:hypothetical protein